MVLEIADIRTRPDEADDFAVTCAKALRHIRSSQGCRSVRLTRGVETPHRFVLLVEWETLNDHTEGFRNSPAFASWREEIGGYLAEPPNVEHVEIVD